MHVYSVITAMYACLSCLVGVLLLVNDQEQIQALVDKTKVIITEDSIRSDLHFDDAEGNACLLNEAIFEGLARMSAKTTTWNEFSSTMLTRTVIDLQEAKAAQAKEIVALKKKVTKLNKWRKSRSGGLRRLNKFGSGRRVKPFMEKDSLGAQEDASKQGRMIEEIDKNAEIALDDETQGRTNDDEMFGVDDLAGEEVVVDTTTGEHEEQIIEDVSTTKPVTTVGEVVTTTTIKDSTALTTYVTEDEITMAQALAALKSIKPKVVVQEQEMSTTISVAAKTITTADKVKAKMIEPEVPIKKKDQMRIDEEYARRLEAEEQEAVRLSRAQQDEEANNSWDNIQAMMDADRLLAERLQAREREEFFKVQKGISFDEIKKLFDREIRKVNDFIAMDSEAQESSTKRTTKHLESDISKTQKVDENVEQVIDDTEELKNCIGIVPDDRDEVDYDVKMAYDLLRFIRKQLMEEMAFRCFIYTEDDDDLAFLPKESSLGFGIGSPSASVNTEPPKDVEEPEVQPTEVIANSESLKVSVFIVHPGSVAARIKERKCKTRGGSSRPHVKRKLASESSSSRAVRAKTSSSKDDAPFLSISDDDEDLEQLDLHDCCYARQAMVDNIVNRRAHEFLQVIKKMSGEADVIKATKRSREEECKGLRVKCEAAMAEFDQNPAVLALQENISSLATDVKEHKDKARLEAVEASLRREVKELKQDRRDVILKVVPYAVMELVHSDELGRLVDKLKDIVLHTRRIIRRLANDFATATFPWLDEFVADVTAPIETLLSKKPPMLQKPAPLRTQIPVHFSHKATPYSAPSLNPMSPPADLVKPSLFLLE
nr:hypothetical protein [Tanacetum cinerariifolium]